MRWWKIAFGLLLLGAIAAVVVLNLGPKEEIELRVQTEKARIEPITQVVTASGKIRPETEVKVTADVGGYIRKLTVEQGDRVEVGQLLVEIDTEIYRARVQESLAAEKTARANLALAEAGLTRVASEEKRVRGLFAKELTSRSALEKAEADRAIAEAEVAAARGRLMQAQATLDKARKDLAKCTITAPIAGTVTVLNKEQGERASGGDFREDIIMHVSDLSSMEVEVEVGERDVVLIEEGDQVDIEVDAFTGEKLGGRVKEVANAGITRNQWTESEVTNFRVVIQVLTGTSRLRPQMSATVEIQTAHHDQALTVPIQSVTLRRPREIAGGAGGPGAAGAGREGRGPRGADARIGESPVRGGRDQGQPIEVVFVLDGGRVQAVPVTTGLSSDTRIEVTEGLAAGAEVVSGPYRALSKELEDGAAVRVAPPPGRDRRRSGRRGR